jgi:hypothetical protein
MALGRHSDAVALREQADIGNSVLGGRDIPVNVRALVLKTCILPVLTHGCEVWGIDSTSGVNRLQAISIKL